MIYLDNSATTRPFDRVVQKMAQSMGEGFFNPSSLYAQALLASDEIKRAKGLISAFAACRSRATRPIWPQWMHPAWCAWTSWWTMWGRTRPWCR